MATVNFIKYKKQSAGALSGCGCGSSSGFCFCCFLRER